MNLDLLHTHPAPHISTGQGGGGEQQNYTTGG